MRKVLLFIIMVAMLASGLLMLAFALWDPTPRSTKLFIAGGAIVVFVGIYLLWTDFLAPLLGIKSE